MKKRRSAVCLALTALLLGSCTAPPAPPPVSAPVPKPEPAPLSYDRLTIYTALPEAEATVYLNAFRKDTGIEVAYERFSAGEMLARTRAEQDAPQVSVLLGGSADTYVQAHAEGLLTPYQSPELIDVPEAYLDQAQVWNPIYIGVLCFACNRDWFTAHDMDYPTSWSDLLAPALAGQIVMPYPEFSGTSYTMLAAVLQQQGEARGWDYLRTLSRSVAAYTYSSNEMVDRVLQGEYAVGIAFSHDARRAVLDGYPVELRFPEDGTGYEIGACALVAGGPAAEQDNARRFIDWMTSQRGQECYIEAKSSRLPANSTARSADGLPDLKDIKLALYDYNWAGQNRSRLIAQFKREIAGT